LEGGFGGFFFPLFPTCSFQVPNGFPSSSQYVLEVPSVFHKGVLNSTLF
jgi:hypothetical protein